MLGTEETSVERVGCSQKHLIAARCEACIANRKILHILKATDASITGSSSAGCTCLLCILFCCAAISCSLPEGKSARRAQNRKREKHRPLLEAVGCMDVHRCLKPHLSSFPTPLPFAAGPIFFFSSFFNECTSLFLYSFLPFSKIERGATRFWPS